MTSQDPENPRFYTRLSKSFKFRHAVNGIANLVLEHLETGSTAVNTSG